MKRIALLVLIIWIGVIGLSLAADNESDQFQIYIVKKGDTLSEIAFAFKVSEEDLIKWNPELGIRLIYPGQRIRWQKSTDKLGKKFDSLSKKLDKLEGSLAKAQKEIVPMESKPSPVPSPREKNNLLWVLLLIVVLSILSILLALRKPRSKLSKKSELIKSTTEEAPKEDRVEKVVSDVFIGSYKISSTLDILGERYEDEETKILCPFCAKEITTKNFRRHILNRCQKITQEERTIIKEKIERGFGK